MDILLDPNVAYLLLAGGLMLAVLAVLSPGTGLLELAALFALILAGYAVTALPINLWALAVLVLGVVPFLLAIRKPGQYALLAAAIVAFVAGSAFLFRGEAWWQPAVNPILALVVSVLSGSYFWVLTQKFLEVESVQPTHDLEALIGSLGEAKTNIYETGSVQVDGELWSAISDHPISTGSQVRVTGREGFVLKVEAVQSTK